MKTLIVGGTGGLGGFIALELDKQGHAVTLAARNPAKAATPIAHMPVLLGSYAQGDFPAETLEGFDNIVFAAANDPRQAPRGATDADERAFYTQMNSVAVPAFFVEAKRAGVRRTAYIGSFYPQAAPHLVSKFNYIQSRKVADENIRKLADDRFHVVSLNAPWIVGAMPGQENPMYTALARWAKGQRPDVPNFAMPGGVNFMSVQSLSDAVIGGLTRGENGRGYLVGGENLRFKQLFDMFFRAAGRGDMELEVRDQEHPLYRDGALFAGRANTIFYEPEGVETLSYDPVDVERIVTQIVADTP